MSLFVLREGFQVVALAGDLSRIVHLRTGDSLEISQEDATILVRATRVGLSSADPWIGSVVQRYEDLGLLVQATTASLPDQAAGPAIPPIAAATPTPGAYSPTPALKDPVPEFLGTLKMVTQGSSSLVQVNNPATGKTFQLYDFEISLARMLDGRRPHSEVVESAQRLGIPVTFDGLVQFIRQLDRYGFLVPATGTKSGGPKDSSSWPPREKWDEATRTLYQSGLRMHRQGRYSEAATYFEAILTQDPKNPEALQMFAEANERALNPPIANLAPLPAPANPKIERFDALSIEDAPTSGANLASEAGAQTPPTPALSSPVAPTPPTTGSRPAGRWISPPIAILLGVVVFGAATWAVLSRRGSTPPSVPAGAVVASTAHAGGAPVQVDSTNPDLRSPPTAALDAGQVEAGQADAGQVDAGQADAGQADAGQADAGELPAQAESRKWLVARIGKRGRVTMGELNAPADGTVHWKVAEEQRVKRGEWIGSFEGETKLLAPVAGLVMRKVAEGGTVHASQLLASFLYHEAYLQTVVTGGRPDPGWACEVVDEATRDRADCKVNSATPRGDGFFVTAIVVPRWFDASVEPVLRLAPP